MQPRQLRYFVKIVEAGSFSLRGVRHPRRTTSPEPAIAELEDRFDITPLQRRAHGVRLTATGEILSAKVGLDRTSYI